MTGPHASRPPGQPIRRRRLLATAPGLSVLAAPTAHADQPSAAATPQPAGPRVRTGFETLAEAGFEPILGARLGLIANQTAILPDLRHEAQALRAAPGVRLRAIFGPEHGYRGAAPAGAGTADHRDPDTGLPVYDAYAKSPATLARMFAAADLQVVAFDVQDVGARFYTFAGTMCDAMVAAALADVRFLVFDRPNPLGGQTIGGPPLTPGHTSLVGRLPIPLRHGLTVAELARLANEDHVPRRAGRPARLSVAPMRGWARWMSYQDTGLPWVQPSPNIPTLDTTVVYPGAGLLEGTNLSEGRGLTRPFENVGGAYLDQRFAPALAAELDAADLRGVRLRPTCFTPAFGRFAGVAMRGVQLYVTDRRRFDPTGVGVAILAAARRLHQREFAWIARGPRRPHWIDYLSGSPQLRAAIDAGVPAAEIIAGWQPSLRAFADRRRACLS